MIPARSLRTAGNGRRIEVLLLTPKGDDVWEVLVNPGKKALPGTVIRFSDQMSCEVLDKTDFGGRTVRFP